MAVRRLFEIDDPAALATFIELLDDDDEWFVEKAIDAIRHWVSAENRKVVVSLSIRSEVRLRQLAAELSPRIGKEALPVLSTLCTDPETSVSREAWRARLIVDAGTIPVAIENEDHMIRKMAIATSGDSELLEKMLSDEHPRVREVALNQMQKIGHNPPILDSLLDGPLRIKAANLRLPYLIDAKATSTIATLCLDCDSKLRNVLAKSLDGVDWFSWMDVVDAAKESADHLLLPRLLRSRREPQADSLRLDVLKNGDDSARVRILEDLHGRPVSEKISDLLPTLISDSNPLLSQVASSLIADSNALEMGS
jgi:HEAT repeat protein